MLLFAAAALPALLGAGQPPPAGCIDVPAPKVSYRPNIAQATSSPWVDSNAWRYLRNPEAKFCIDAGGKQAPLAAAEAFAYGVAAFLKGVVEPDRAFDGMMEFLRGLPPFAGQPLANIGIVDDGTPRMGELMNLMARRNLLFRVEKAPDPRLDVNVTRVDGSDPGKEAYAIRQRLGDDKRWLRLYGSEVVLGRLTGDSQSARLHLVNYAGRPVNGLRVRVLGNYSTAAGHVFGEPGAALADFSHEAGATEFTLPVMHEYAVIDLAR